MFQVERPQEVLKTYFVVTTKEKSKAELKQTFLERTQCHFGKLVFSFRWDRHYFSEGLSRSHQNNCIQYKTTKTTFPKKSKAVFTSIRYRKTSQTQDVKSQSTEQSVRKKGQPKRASAFEKKARIVSFREISAISQNSFFSYNQKIKPLRAQKDIFGTYSMSFRKVSVLLKKQKLFISIRYHKTSQTQDVKSWSTKPSLRKLERPKRDSAFEQKTRIFRSGETSGSSLNIFFSYYQRKNQIWAQTDILGTHSTSFWKVGLLLSMRSPKFFGRLVRKSSKQLQTIQNEEDHVSEKFKSCFYKYSVSQDISNARCKEPKYRT